MREDKNGVKHETLCYVLRGEEVLFIEKKRGFLGGYSVPPGGGLEESDNGDFEKCARRELEEETGLVADKLKEIGHILFDNSARDFGKGVGKEPNHSVKIFEVPWKREYEYQLRETAEGKPFLANWNALEGLKMPVGDMVLHKWVRERRGRYFIGCIKNTPGGIDEEVTGVTYI